MEEGPITTPEPIIPEELSLTTLEPATIVKLEAEEIEELEELPTIPPEEPQLLPPPRPQLVINQDGIHLTGTIISDRVSAHQITTELPIFETGFYEGATLVFLSGNLSGERRTIDSYVNGVLTFENTFSETPQQDDKFFISDLPEKLKQSIAAFPSIILQNDSQQDFVNNVQKMQFHYDRLITRTIQGFLLLILAGFLIAGGIFIGLWKHTLDQGPPRRKTTSH